MHVLENQKKEAWKQPSHVGSFPSSNSSSTETPPCNLHQKRSIRAPRIGQLPRISNLHRSMKRNTSSSQVTIILTAASPPNMGRYLAPRCDVERPSVKFYIEESDYDSNEGEEDKDLDLVTSNGNFWERRSAFDDADDSHDVIQSRSDAIKPNIDLRNKAPELRDADRRSRPNHVEQQQPQQLKPAPQCRASATLPHKGPDRLANNERGSLSGPSKAQSTSSVSSISGIGGESTAIGTMASSQESIRQLQKGTSNERTAGNFAQTSKTSTLSNFASVIESTKTLSINDERQRSPTKTPQPLGFVPTPGRNRAHPGANAPSIPSPDDEDMVKINPRKVPIPAKCSSQLRRLIHSHSLCQPPVPNPAPPPPAQSLVPMPHSPSLPGKRANDAIRPIFPQLPYSPYASPNSSPRVKRKPLRETTRVNSITESTGEFVQLNQYKLHESLGQGSYGIVKLAYNKEDNSHYAMKILSKKKLKRQGGLFSRGIPNRKAPGGGSRKMAEGPLQKVYREIAIMKKLDHPNVVKLVEVLDDPEDENLYMVFEFLKGGEVLEIPTDRPLDEKAAWLALRDVISGLEYLHYQKIIHRDVKPSNLLRTTDGVVKIADLGVSNEFNGQDDAFLTNSAGTPAFTPPESLSHKPGDDPYSGRRADIWSLGVTLYCLVIGKVPFHDNNILGVHHKIKTQPLSFPENCDISPELKDLVGKMLKKDPNERASLQEIKVHDWVTGFGLYPLPTEEENCELVEITDMDVDNSVRTVPKLDTLILVKSMLKNHSFLNPFHNLRTRLGVNGRSNSAPEVTFFDDRKLEVTMPMVSEEKHDPSET
ncbi:hypothetical protein TCAL_05417 [Tigriopus californicus]|uniref:calcium/calmodulin-dependent protein kinase n=2 Tax=Tigriopus californicus TaxID=6832 RepID=A0A553NYH4_TIGCA|nr:hypothetical protein TCAL_05417 [Tigriopus californicus]